VSTFLLAGKKAVLGWGVTSSKLDARGPLATVRVSLSAHLGGVKSRTLMVRVADWDWPSVVECIVRASSAQMGLLISFCFEPPHPEHGDLT